MKIEQKGYALCDESLAIYIKQLRSVTLQQVEKEAALYRLIKNIILCAKANPLEEDIVGVYNKIQRLTERV